MDPGGKPCRAGMLSAARQGTTNPWGRRSGAPGSCSPGDTMGRGWEEPRWSQENPTGAESGDNEGGKVDSRSYRSIIRSQFRGKVDSSSYRSRFLPGGGWQTPLEVAPAAGWDILEMI